jgi:WD40 repeat protein
VSVLNSCARCGAELRPNKAEGLCTRCLLGNGLEEAIEEPPVSGPDPTPAPLTEKEHGTPRYFADYELLEEIARGGMGVVYRARHLSLGCIVAVKLILAGQFASQQIIQRFRGEVTAAALLQHPNIVAIHDVGIHDGQHYFSMDYVEGQNLSQLVGNRPLPPAKAARYVKLIAEAIHYAHGQGILHRDLKPSNVLVDASDQPRITDFGLAKRLDGDASITMTGQMLGSPNFMPPEQASSQCGKVGRHSDVYGLGAILYHLLTARPPFQAESFESVITQLLNAEPVSPRLLNSRVPADLETICVKCLQKEPARRFQSALELADELGRFLRHEPIQARPVTLAERTWRWCRRKPALASLGVSLVMVFTLGFIGTLWQWRQAVHNAQAEARQRQLADGSRERADQNLYDSDMNLAQHSWDEGDLGRTLGLLEAHLPRTGGPDRRSFEWFYFWNLCRGDQLKTLTNHSQAVDCVAISPDGKRLATGSVGNPVQIWDTATGRRVKTLPEENVVSLAFAPDGRTLGVGGQDQMVVWNLETGRAVFKREDALGRFRIVFSPEGTLLVAGKRGGLKFFGFDGGSTELWDYVTGELKHVFPESGGYIALSPNGHQLVTGNWIGTTKIWDLATGKLVRSLKTGGVIAMAFSPDGQTLATSDRDSKVAFWYLTNGQPIGWLTNNQCKVWSLAFSPKNGLLVTGGADQMIRLWDVVTRQQTEELRGHGSEVMSLAFSADGLTLASGCKDQKAMLWNIHPNRAVTTVSNVISRPVFSPDGRLVAAGTDQGAVALWDVATLQVRAVFAGARDAVAFSADGNVLVTRGADYFLKAFDVATRSARETISRGPAATTNDQAALSPDGQILVIGLTNGTLSFWQARTGMEMATIPQAYASNIFQLVFSPNGKLLAVTGREWEAGRVPAAKIWDVATHTMVKLIAGHRDTVLGVAFSPDGKTMATCGADNSINFWDTTSWREIAPALGQKETVSSVAFAPNGKTLASASFDGTMKLWNFSTRRELASLKLDWAPSNMAFSPDGQTVATLHWDHSLRLWRAPIPDKSQSRLRDD